MSCEKHFFMIGLMLLFLCSGSRAQDGKIVSLPQEITVHEGQVFEALIMVHPGSEPVTVVDYVLSYNPQQLSVLSVEKSEDCPLQLNAIETKIDDEEGSVVYNAFKLQQPWPETLFPLLRIQFLALTPADKSVLHHQREGHPKTILAYAGRDILESAPDIVVHIMPPVTDKADHPNSYDNELNVDCDSGDNTCKIDFSIAENARATLKLISETNGIEEVFFDNDAQVDISYRFQVDTSVLSSGKYKVELSTSGFSRSKEFTVGK